MLRRTLAARLSIVGLLVSSQALAQTAEQPPSAAPPGATTPADTAPGAEPPPAAAPGTPAPEAPPPTAPENAPPAPAAAPPAEPAPEGVVAVAPQPESVTSPVIVNEALDEETRGTITEVHDGDPDEGTPEEGHAGYKPGTGFHIQSADGNYLMRIEMRAALKFEPAWTDGEKDVRGSLAFVRPALRGNFFKPWLRYAFAMELARGDAFLLTANVEVQPWDEFGFRYGQQGTPVSRHSDFAPHNIFFPDYAGVSTFFWSGRQRGLTVFGTLGEDLLNYWVGLFGGSPLLETQNDPDNYIAEARVAVNPWGATNANELPFTPARESLPTRASFALQGYQGKLQTSVDNYNPTNSVLNPLPILVSRKMATGGADAWFQSGPFIASAEYYYRRIQESDGLPGYNSQGVWGQFMLDVYRQTIGVGARFNWLNPNMDVSSDRVLEGEGQVAWFINPRHLVLKLRYALLDQKEPDPAALGPGYQLPFIPGTTNVITLQLTMEL
jgi:hypothetical protein